MNGSCPDGPGHGAASGPGYCRGPVAKRRGTMGRYLRAMAGPDSPQEPAGRGAGYWPRPCLASTWEPRRWAAIRGPRHKPSAPNQPASQGCALFRALPWPVPDLKPRHQIRQVGAATRPVCSGPGRAGLLQGRKVPATGADLESVMIRSPSYKPLVPETLARSAAAMDASARDGETPCTPS